MIGNPDITDVIPAVIAAIKNPDDTPKALDVRKRNTHHTVPVTFAADIAKQRIGGKANT